MTLDDIELNGLEMAPLLPGNDIEKGESIRGGPPYTGELFLTFQCKVGLGFSQELKLKLYIDLDLV